MRMLNSKVDVIIEDFALPWTVQYAVIKASSVPIIFRLDVLSSHSSPHTLLVQCIIINSRVYITFTSHDVPNIEWNQNLIVVQGMKRY